MKNVLLVGLLQVAVTFGYAQSVANSSTDFSGIQGQKNWYYGYAEVVMEDYSKDSIIIFPNYNSSLERWNDNGVGVVPFVMRSRVHPKYKDSSTEYMTVQRWVSEETLDLQVDMTIDRFNEAGNGVQYFIYKDGEQVKTGYVAPGDIEIIEEHIGIVECGTTLDFLISSNGSSAYDATDIEINLIEYLPPALTISDLDFSGTQGVNNWFYGYATSVINYDQSSSFNSFPQFTNDGKWKNTNIDIPFIRANSCFPSFTNGDENPAIRRWISSVSGIIKITGNLNLSSPNGNGVTFNIYSDSGIVLNEEVLPGEEITFSVDTLNVVKGDTIDFLVISKANSTDDSTTFRATIQAVDIISYVEDYGAVGDGIHDDGPAIQAALSDILKSENGGILYLEEGKDYYINNIEGNYLFYLKNKSSISIVGNETTLLLDEDVRCLYAEGSTDITIEGINIDYRPLPFFEANIVGINESNRYIDVKVKQGFEIPSLEGPSGDPREQAYFGLAYKVGNYALDKQHYYVEDMQEAYPGSVNDSILRVYCQDNFNKWNKLAVDDPISLPVSGIAHIGGEPVIDFRECTNFDLSNVDIWSAPWFAIRLMRNKGKVDFVNVNVQAKPGTNRLLSSWRDGVHVKSNYASLTFDSCYLAGMGDDAFNIATFMSSITQVIDHKNIKIKQNYPLQIVPYNPGDVVLVYDIVQGKILGKSKVVSSTGFEQTGTVPAPVISLTLESPIENMSDQCVVWNESSANPNTVIKNSTIVRSCRYQSPVTLDNCNHYALQFFRCSNLEGPISTDIVVKNSNIFETNTSFNTYLKYNGVVYPPKEHPIRNILFQNNQFKYTSSKANNDLRLNYVQNAAFESNTFDSSSGDIIVAGSQNLLFRNNRIKGMPLDTLGKIMFLDQESASETKIEWTIDSSIIDIMKPFAHWYGFDALGNHYRYSALGDSLKPEHLVDIVIGGDSSRVYKIPLPSNIDSTKGIVLQEPLLPGVHTIKFWTYSDDQDFNVKVIVRNTDGSSSEILSTVVSKGTKDHHQAILPGNLNGNNWIVEIKFSSAITTQRPDIYLGDLAFTRSCNELNVESDDQYRSVDHDITHTRNKTSKIINFFPNPAENYAKLVWSEKVQSATNFTLIDQAGVQHEITLDIADNRIQVSFYNELDFGFYMLCGQINYQPFVQKLLIK